MERSSPSVVKYSPEDVSMQVDSPASQEQESVTEAIDEPHSLVTAENDHLTRHLRNMENVIIKFRSVKSINSACFKGEDLTEWLKETLDFNDDKETGHFGNLLIKYGYIFPLSSPYSTYDVIKEANYRIQNEEYWISKNFATTRKENAVYKLKVKELSYGHYELFAWDSIEKEFKGKDWDEIESIANKEIDWHKALNEKEQERYSLSECAFWKVNHGFGMGFHLNETNVIGGRQDKYMHDGKPCGVKSFYKSFPEQRPSRKRKISEERPSEKRREMLQELIKETRKRIEFLKLDDAAEKIKNRNEQIIIYCKNHTQRDKIAVKAQSRRDMEISILVPYTFEDVERDENSYGMFREFVARKYSDYIVHLDFNKACKRFKNFLMIDKPQAATAIYERFIMENAEREISSLPREVRDEITRDMNEKNITPYMFCNAWRHSLDMIEGDVLSDFLASYELTQPRRSSLSSIFARWLRL